MSNASPAKALPWFIICGLDDMYSTPSRRYGKNDINRAVLNWRIDRTNREKLMLPQEMCLSEGNVTFVRKSSGAGSVFHGFILSGVTLFDAAQTRDILRELGGRLLRDLGQDVLEIHCKQEIWCLRRADKDMTRMQLM